MIKDNLDECLEKQHKDMTKEELLYAHNWEVNMLEGIEHDLMLPDATDESLKLAIPLMDMCKENIKKIDELLSEN